MQVMGPAEPLAMAGNSHNLRDGGVLDRDGEVESGDSDDVDLFSSTGGMELEEGSVGARGSAAAWKHSSSSPGLTLERVKCANNVELGGSSLDSPAYFSDKGLGPAQRTKEVGVLSTNYVEGRSALVVANVSTDVEEEDLLALFQRFGEVSSLFTGRWLEEETVIVTFKEAAAAQQAHHGLQRFQLKRRHLTVQSPIDSETVRSSLTQVNQLTDSDLLSKGLSSTVGAEHLLILTSTNPAAGCDELAALLCPLAGLKEVIEVSTEGVGPSCVRRYALKFSDAGARTRAAMLLTSGALVLMPGVGLLYPQLGRSVAMGITDVPASFGQEQGLQGGQIHAKSDWPGGMKIGSHVKERALGSAKAGPEFGSLLGGPAPASNVVGAADGGSRLGEEMNFNPSCDALLETGRQAVPGETVQPLGGSRAILELLSSLAANGQALDDQDQMQLRALHQKVLQQQLRKRQEQQHQQSIMQNQPPSVQPRQQLLLPQQQLLMQQGQIPGQQGPQQGKSQNFQSSAATIRHGNLADQSPQQQLFGQPQWLQPIEYPPNQSPQQQQKLALQQQPEHQDHHLQGPSLILAQRLQDWKIDQPDFPEVFLPAAVPGSGSDEDDEKSVRGGQVTFIQQQVFQQQGLLFSGLRPQSNSLPEYQSSPLLGVPEFEQNQNQLQMSSVVPGSGAGGARQSCGETEVGSSGHLAGRQGLSMQQGFIRNTGGYFEGQGTNVVGAKQLVQAGPRMVTVGDISHARASAAEGSNLFNPGAFSGGVLSGGAGFVRVPKVSSAAARVGSLPDHWGIMSGADKAPAAGTRQIADSGGAGLANWGRSVSPIPAPLAVHEQQQQLLLLLLHQQQQQRNQGQLLPRGSVMSQDSPLDAASTSSFPLSSVASSLSTESVVLHRQQEQYCGLMHGPSQLSLSIQGVKSTFGEASNAESDRSMQLLHSCERSAVGDGQDILCTSLPSSHLHMTAAALQGVEKDGAAVQAAGTGQIDGGFLGRAHSALLHPLPGPVVSATGSRPGLVPPHSAQNALSSVHQQQQLDSPQGSARREVPSVGGPVGGSKTALSSHYVRSDPMLPDRSFSLLSELSAASGDGSGTLGTSLGSISTVFPGVRRAGMKSSGQGFYLGGSIEGYAAMGRAGDVVAVSPGGAGAGPSSSFGVVGSQSMLQDTLDNYHRLGFLRPSGDVANSVGAPSAAAISAQAVYVGQGASGSAVDAGSTSPRTVGSVWGRAHGTGAEQREQLGCVDRGRAGGGSSRRGEGSGRSDGGDGRLGDSKRLFVLELDKILSGEDTRTTLMLKNIPNKYTQKMLLAAIDEKHKGAYDFFYLPIDFKNKCNVGYAFINMADPLKIIPLYQTFNGKRWEKFNSEKVANLAYARIQGKPALIAHFQNSSLMNEDKRCRPILFHSEGPNAGDQEPFPVGVNVRPRRDRPGERAGSTSGSSAAGIFSATFGSAATLSSSASSSTLVDTAASGVAIPMPGMTLGGVVPSALQQECHTSTLPMPVAVSRGVESSAFGLGSFGNYGSSSLFSNSGFDLGAAVAAGSPGVNTTGTLTGAPMRAIGPVHVSPRVPVFPSASISLGSTLAGSAPVVGLDAFSPSPFRTSSLASSYRPGSYLLGSRGSMLDSASPPDI